MHPLLPPGSLVQSYSLFQSKMLTQSPECRRTLQIPNHRRQCRGHGPNELPLKMPTDYLSHILSLVEEQKSFLPGRCWGHWQRAFCFCSPGSRFSRVQPPDNTERTGSLLVSWVGSLLPPACFLNLVLGYIQLQLEGSLPPGKPWAFLHSLQPFPTESNCSDHSEI